MDNVARTFIGGQLKKMYYMQGQCIIANRNENSFTFFLHK